MEYIESGKNRELAAMITTSAVFDDSNDIEIGLKELNSTTIAALVSEIFESETKTVSVKSTGLSVPLSFVLAEPHETTNQVNTKQVNSVEVTQATSSSRLYIGDNVISESHGGLSVGFPCYYWNNQTCYPGFVTAAHGCKLGDKMYDLTGAVVGTVMAYQYSGTVDAAFVGITNSNYAIPTVIEAVSDGGSSIDYYTVNLGNYAIPAVGTTIYKDGKTTNLTTGVVDSTSASLWITEDNVTITDMIRTSECIVDNGDSGGLAFTLGTGIYASPVGITQGYSYIFGIELKSFFVKYGNIVSELGLSSTAGT